MRQHKVVVVGHNEYPWTSQEWRGDVAAKEARLTVAKRIAASLGLTGRVLNRKGYVRILSAVDSSNPGWGFVEVS